MIARGFVIEDQFVNGIVSPHWVRYAIGYGDFERRPNSLRLVVENAEADQLSDAEINDLRGRPRLPWMPPLRMEIRARMSHPAVSEHGGSILLGTAGFGFWNDPFDLEKGGAVAAPNAVWFFYASPPNEMSFTSDVPGTGWKAGCINGGQVAGPIVAIGNWLLSLPGIDKLAYRFARSQIHASERLLDDVDEPAPTGASRPSMGAGSSVDTTEWHDYAIDWGRDEAVFWVDDRQVLCALRPPTAPLGFVAWVDNNFAVTRPDGTADFGRIPVPQRQWLELAYLRIEKL